MSGMEVARRMAEAGLVAVVDQRVSFAEEDLEGGRRRVDVLREWARWVSSFEVGGGCFVRGGMVVCCGLVDEGVGVVWVGC